MAFVAANGVQLEVFDAGAGEPSMVFIHGWACDSRAWQAQFDDLARDHRCVAINLRGRGRSEAKPPFDVSQQAADVAAVLQALGIERAVVVGHTLGGVVALHLNHGYPELVRGIVIGDPPINPTGPSMAGIVEAVRSSGSTEPMKRVVERFWRDGTPPAVQDYARTTMYGCPPEVAAGMVDGEPLVAEHTEALIKEADRKPFMVIWAEPPIGDPVWLRNVTVFLRQEPIAGAGHFFQMEQPAITNALLRAFLDDVERDPRG